MLHFLKRLMKFYSNEPMQYYGFNCGLQIPLSSPLPLLHFSVHLICTLLHFCSIYALIFSSSPFSLGANSMSSSLCMRSSVASLIRLSSSVSSAEVLGHLGRLLATCHLSFQYLGKLSHEEAGTSSWYPLGEGGNILFLHALRLFRASTQQRRVV